MKAHDLTTRTQAESEYQQWIDRYLERVPNADIQSVVFNAVDQHKIANVEGLTYANLSVFTKTQGIQKAYESLPQDNQNFVSIGLNIGL